MFIVLSSDSDGLIRGSHLALTWDPPITCPAAESLATRGPATGGLGEVGTANYKMESSHIGELFPGLPEEIGLECLTRLPCSSHQLASRVCRRWRHLIKSPDFYYHRKSHGFTHRVACLVQTLPAPPAGDGAKHGGASQTYGITTFDPAGRVWERVDPIPKYPGGLPLFSQLAGCEGKLVVMGGWDPATYDPVRDVFVYEFSARRWRRARDMPSKRSFFAMGAVGNRIYVAGGHDEGKNALRSAWVYDLRSDEWSELPQMGQERDECEGVVVGGEFWVVSGFRTESQGAFDSSAESYDPESGEWRRIDSVWAPGECPRSCVGVAKDGTLVNWAGSNSSIRVGPCGVALMARTLVTGSEYQGGPNAFYMVQGQNGQNHKWEKISVPQEFCGFVQSGCSVEI